MRQTITLRYAVLAIALLAARHAAAAERSYAAGRFSIDINGERQLVNSVEGGSPVGVVAANGTDKHIAGVKYDDIVFTIPLANLPKPVVDALDGKPSPVNGGIDYLNFDYKSQRRVSFQDATVAAVRFPALDGSSKEAATVEIVLAPQQTREEAPSGDVKGAAAAAKQKAALRSAFRVTLPGLPAERVATVSAIEVRAKRVESAVGTERISTKTPTEMEIPNIKLTMSQADLKPWQQWLEKMVVEGGSNQEKTMRVDFLDASLKNPIATIDLSGVGIVAIRPQKAEAGAESVQRVEIELYAEQIKFGPGKATAAAADTDSKSATAAPAETAPAGTAETAKPTAVPERSPIRRAR